MSISIACSCGRKFRAADQAIGRNFRCPSCGISLTATPPEPPAPDLRRKRARARRVAVLAGVLLVAVGIDLARRIPLHRRNVALGHVLRGHLESARVSLIIDDSVGAATALKWALQARPSFPLEARNREMLLEAEATLHALDTLWDHDGARRYLLGLGDRDFEAAARGDAPLDAAISDPGSRRPILGYLRRMADLVEPERRHIAEPAYRKANGHRFPREREDLLAEFDRGLARIRAMDEEIRIRTHNESADDVTQAMVQQLYLDLSGHEAWRVSTAAEGGLMSAEIGVKMGNLRKILARPLEAAGKP
jgi:hypothetical protein